MCGDPYSPFDELGCERPSCPCADGEICFIPFHYAGCLSTALTCTGDSGTCTCNHDDGCDGAYCLPAEDAPAPCTDQTDAAACDELLCGWDGDVESADVAFDGNGCTCTPRSGFCLSNASDFLGELEHYYRPEEPDLAVVTPVYFEPVPGGLIPCPDVDPPPGCACAVSTNDCGL
jgi:hypothetical protein